MSPYYLYPQEDKREVIAETMIARFKNSGYGNLDIILDHFPRISWLDATPHAPYDILYTSVHAYLMPIGACVPMTWPIHACGYDDMCCLVQK